VERDITEMAIQIRSMTEFQRVWER